MTDATIWHPDMPDEYKNQIVTGDARVLAERIPDESIDLVFTDPIYDRIDDYRWLAETAARVLKPDQACLAYLGIGYAPDVHDALRAGGLSYRWRFVTRMVNSKEFNGRLLITSKECLWYEKGHSKPLQSIFDVDLSTKKGIVYNNNGANWGKGTSVPLRYINTFCPAGAIVFDPFCGLGTFEALAKVLGRNYIAFEIDPATADLARERVRNTQPPLFVLESEQLELAL